MTVEEKRILSFYRKLLTLCNREKAIAKGSFFDLMYVNQGGWNFNEHKQYAFLRKYEDELLLIAVNFDNVPARVSINIPQHAFDFLEIPEITD